MNVARDAFGLFLRLYRRCCPLLRAALLKGKNVVLRPTLEELQHEQACIGGLMKW